ncbi:hypothetical protein RhiirA4_487534 [Rhizophagus irregularis]|uniref:Uncharacterized protein n=1 Tax=Rhizophagus irregularis TaxID=588596 RepID=A0A2I1HSM9_9GLOM|nr:hypothetical protein RhiirA4_487534 [Rhizophagus irregularis]
MALLKFMELSNHSIKSNIWKVRSRAWKQWKTQHGITKNSFKRYKHSSSRCLNVPHHSPSLRGYICPQTRFDVSVVK